MQALATDEIFLFEGFRLDRRAGGLFQLDENSNLVPVPIGSSALDLLFLIVRRRGELVSKDEIMTAIWPGVIVEDSNLPTQISALRRVLDRGRSQGSCIQTVPGRGYRFVGTVAQTAEDVLAVSSPVYDAPRAPPPIDGRTNRPLSRPLIGGASSTRRLTAILAADVAGYSRLMGEDEEGTHERLQSHLRGFVDPKITEHRGRVVKHTGDGFLAEFASVVDAVRCATEIQRGMADRNAPIPPEKRIELRVGINLGDVIVEGHDIFGDGVNVAARLEALAEPGGICVSRVVRDQVRDRLDFGFEDMGEQNVKNIARPVRVFAMRAETIAERPMSDVSIAVPRSRRNLVAPIAAGVAAVLVICGIGWWFWPASQSSSTPPAAVATAATSLGKPLVAPRLSIVVLPFDNLSNDPDQQYFADGITEDITTDLSRVRDMFVISRNTAFTYRNKPVDTRQIGRELGVRYMLEGSVQRSGSQLRLSAQLIDAASDTHLWADRFDRATEDLFAAQTDITNRLANALGIELIAAEAARPTERPDALDYIFRGRAAWLRPWTRDGYDEAIRMYELALEIDPHSADAQSELASALASRVLAGVADAAATDISRAEMLAAQAVAESPRSSFAHFSKGQVLRAHHLYTQAIREYETAIAFDRNSASAFFALGLCKLSTGAIEETIPLEEQAIRLSPSDPQVGIWYQAIGRVHLLLSRTDDAILWFEKAQSANPALPFMRAEIASAYALKGDTERAAAELTEARRLSADDRYTSIVRLKASREGISPKINALAEATFIAGLRKAGMPDN